MDDGAMSYACRWGPRAPPLRTGVGEGAGSRRNFDNGMDEQSMAHKGHAWQAGQSGNPGGLTALQRKFNQRVLARLKLDFEQHGDEAIRQAREEDPMGYVRCCVALIPKSATLEVTQGREWTDALRELSQELRANTGMRLHEAGELLRDDDDGADRPRAHPAAGVDVEEVARLLR